VNVARGLPEEDAKILSYERSIAGAGDLERSGGDLREAASAIVEVNA